MRTDELEMERYSRRSLPSPREVVSVPFRQKWVLLAAFLGVVAAVILSGVWVPKYQAKMKILVQRQRSDAMITSSSSAPAQFIANQVTEEDLNSEVELLNSEDLLRKVVVKTGLQSQRVGSSEPDEDVRIATEVRKLATTLKIEPLRKSNVISVQYENRNPRLAAEVLRSLAAAYMEKHLEVHRPSGEFKFFDQQTELYRRGLERAQAQLADFTNKSGVVEARIERDSALQRANEFDSTSHQAQTSLIEMEQRVRTLQEQLQLTQPRMTTVTRSSDNPQLLQQLKSTLLNLQLKRTELLTKYEPTYRLVQEVDRQIDNAKSAILAEEGRPVREETTDQNPNYQWIRAELTKAESDLSGLKARKESSASVAARYRESARILDQSGMIQQDLMREEKTQEDNYLLYVHRREEARISADLDQRGILNVALVEQPIVPALPNRSPLGVALLTILFAGTLSVSLAFVVDMMDPSFRTPDEVSNYLGVPVLAALTKGN